MTAPVLPSPHSAQTKAKREALSVLADYFCLNSKMAAELLGVTERAVQLHYKALIEQQLVYAFPYYPEEQTKGAAPLAYGLTESGVSKAFAEGFATDSTKTIKQHAKKTIEHEILISRFHLELANLCEANGWDLRWRQRDLKHGVHPDALFSINGHFFFLEVERAKLGNYRNGEPQILRKLRSYWEYYDSTDCENEFGFRKFRVVTIMRTPARSANLVSFLRTGGLDKATFLTTSESDLFKFTSAKDLSEVPISSII